MKIIVSASGQTLDANVDPRFGRCRYFIIVNSDNMKSEVVENSGAQAGGGAGVAAAQMIVGKGVDEVLTGNCGPNAFQVLSAAGIKVITGVSGKVVDSIKEYKLGNYSPSNKPNVIDHFGINDKRGMGRGRGKGMGMGRGMNKGVGIRYE